MKVDIVQFGQTGRILGNWRELVTGQTGRYFDGKRGPFLRSNGAKQTSEANSTVRRLVLQTPIRLNGSVQVRRPPWCMSAADKLADKNGIPTQFLYAERCQLVWPIGFGAVSTVAFWPARPQVPISPDRPARVLLRLGPGVPGSA